MLVNCIECDYTIAASAKRCPKCNSKFPHGLPCRICGKKVQYNKAIIRQYRCSCLQYDCDHHDDDFYYHAECVYKLLSIPQNFTCPDCNHLVDNSIIPNIRVYLSWKEGDLWYLSCKNCGSANVLKFKYFCNICCLPLYGFHEEVSCKYYDCIGEIERQAFFHKDCANNNAYWTEEINLYNQNEKQRKEKSEMERNAQEIGNTQNNGCLGSIVLFIAFYVALGSLMLLR